MATDLVGRFSRCANLAALTLTVIVCWFVSAARAAVDVWTSHGPEGGYVRSLVQDPTDPAILYAATSGGGVFKSTDHGGSWAAINNGIVDPDMNNVAVDPLNPSTLYASGIADIFKSTDGGASWSATGVGPTGGVVVVAPSSPATLYTGGMGVSKSTDGAVSWIPASNGLPDSVFISALTVDPSNASTLYAGTFNTGIFRTTDGGENWVPANTGLLSNNIFSLWADPVKVAGVYASTLQELSKSSDGGDTWTPLTSTWTTLDGRPSRPGVASFAVDPSNPSTLYLGLIGGTVSKSSDGGGSWSTVFSGSAARFVNSLTLEASNPSTVCAGTDAGIFRTTDAGASWASADTGLTASYVMSLAVASSNASTLYAAVQTASINLGLFKSTDAADSWTRTSLGGITPTAVAVDAANPATVYVASDSTISKSTDAGGSWTSSTLPVNPLTIVVAPSLSSVVYVGTDGEGVLWSADGGASWTAMNDGLTDMRVTAVAIDPTDWALAYAGTQSGVFKLEWSYDGVSWSSHWTPFNDGLTNASISYLLIVPWDPWTLYAGTNGGGIFTRGRNSWCWYGTLLTDSNVTSIAVDTRRHAIYAATDSGVFESPEGYTWTNIGLRDRYIASVGVKPSNPPTVYAGTSGGGVFEIEQRCGNGDIDSGEQCDDGAANGIENWSCCTTMCTYSPTCPVADTMAYAARPVTVVIPRGRTSVAAHATAMLANADTAIWPYVQLVATDGDCPAGTVAGDAVFPRTRYLPADQGSTRFDPAHSRFRTATIPLQISSAAFDSFNTLGAHRCRLQVKARPLTFADRNWSNDATEIELNVLDRNDLPQATAHESIIRSMARIAITIQASVGTYAGSICRRYGSEYRCTNLGTVNVPVSVGNADVNEPAGHLITVTASDGDCPAGTVGVPNFARLPARQNSIVVPGGKFKSGYVPVTVDASRFTTANPLSPVRCTAIVTATGPTDPDPEPTNNTTELVIDVADTTE